MKMINMQKIRNSLKIAMAVMLFGLPAYSQVKSTRDNFMTPSSSEKPSPVMLSDLKRLIESDGKSLIDSYRISSRYPYGCIQMAQRVDSLLKANGIESGIAEGYVDNDSVFVNRSNYHMFNVVSARDDNGICDEYILDFTANQFTLNIEQFLNDGVWDFKIIPNTGKDIIPYIERKSESPYNITRYLNSH